MKNRWRRGTFKVSLTPYARVGGMTPERNGQISEPFAVHRNEHDLIVITHLPTGLTVAAERKRFDSFAQAKDFADRLVATGFDWSGPRNASLDFPPSKKTQWFREAEKSYQQVFAQSL